MKKLHLVALLGLFAAFCGFVFTSCGDDDDDDDSSNPIAGTWSMTESESEQNFSRTNTISFTFTSDGKYTQTQEGKHQSPEFTEEYGYGESGTYTLSGNDLTLTPTAYAWKNQETGQWEEESGRNEGYSWKQTIAIEGKTLYIALYENGEQLALTKK